jgi:hypothetical protein
MKKLDLPGWAAVAEISGTAAIVVSLAFVVYSINQNTAALQANNDNFLYQLTIDTSREIARNPELASMSIRVRRGEELTEIELEQYQNHLWTLMNNWEIAYDRYSDGLLTETQWRAWDRSYQPLLGTDFPMEWWPDWKYGHGDGFRRHIEDLMSEEN